MQRAGAGERIIVDGNDSARPALLLGGYCANVSFIQLFRSALSQFDCFECRDQSSFDALGGMVEAGRLVAGTDDTFLQPVGPAPRVVRRRWLHVSSFRDQMDGFQIDVMRYNPQAIRANFGSIVFWECLPEEDSDLFRDLQAACGDVHRISLGSLNNKELPLQPQDFMLTALFHPHLAATRAPDRLARANAGIMRRKEMVTRLLYGAAATEQRAQARA